MSREVTYVWSVFKMAITNIKKSHHRFKHLEQFGNIYLVTFWKTYFWLGGITKIVLWIFVEIWGKMCLGKTFALLMLFANDGL